MGLNLEPVKVSIEIETTSLAREAFYNICFITENEKAPRTLKVERLRDLLDNGYDRSSLAYNFCVGVFAQQGIPFVYVRAKRAVESYANAFSADDNSNYYFVVIESKELYEISDFNQYLSSVDENKLQFYSNNSHDISEISKGKVVNYYQEFFDFSGEEDYYLNKAYKIVTSHNYSSKPYPALVEKQDYVYAELSALESVFREVVKERFFGDGSDQFTTSLIPTDSLFRSVVRTCKIHDTEESVNLDTVTCYAKPLDSFRKSVLITNKQDFKESISNEIKPLDSTLKKVVITHKVSGLGDVITQTIRPLDIIRQG